MLWEEGDKYTRLTGEDWRHTPINKMGAYLDGYNKGMEVIDKIILEIEKHRRKTDMIDYYDLVGDCLDIIDRVRNEESEQ